MLERLKKILHFCGVDRAIFYTILNRGWSVISGPISIYFIARYLSREEQGYYYTFGSILGLQVFFELGLGFVVMQSVSHEMAHLAWSPDGQTLTGTPEAKSRLGSLFRFALKIYAVLAVLVFCTLLPVGLWFFASKSHPGTENVVWQIPWLIVVAITSLNLFLTPFYGLLEGCGKVAEFAKRGSWMAIVGSVTLWIALISHGRLFATPVQNICCFAIGACWVFGKFGRCFRDLWKTPLIEGTAINWKKDILQFQWKIALSWVSSYFIFQLINPLLFRFRGPAEAGQMGMSMKIVNAISSLGLAWVSTKSAPFGTYIGKKDYQTLDQVFNSAARQSIAVIALGSGIFIIAYYVLEQMGISLIHRFLTPLPLLFLLANALVNCIIFGQAIYLRAHKQEPLLLNSIAGAIITPLMLLFVVPKFGACGVAIGIFCINFFMGLPWCYFIYKKKKKEWHTAELVCTPHER